MRFSSPSKFTLTVEGGRERHVIQGPFGCPVPRIGGHAGNAILSLLRGQLPAELICCDVGLGNGKSGEREKKIEKSKS